jgi:ribosomal protein L19E
VRLGPALEEGQVRRKEEEGSRLHMSDVAQVRGAHLPPLGSQHGRHRARDKREVVELRRCRTVRAHLRPVGGRGAPTAVGRAMTSRYNLRSLAYVIL